MANPGEYTMRAYLNGKMDLTQAEAVADLIASTNQATHHLAIQQLRGQVSTQLSHLRDQLLHLTSLLELELDFSDHEDLEFADRHQFIQLTQTIDTHIQQLANSFKLGNAIKNGIPVAIVGAPNVGKSTLLNALVGEERAIVSEIQGTTRDTIEDSIQIDGITYRFIDTAGIRHTTDKVESLGINRSLTAAKKAQIILMVTEPGIPFPNIPLRKDQTVIRIKNKTESFQAKYGIGIDALRNRISATVPRNHESDIIITNVRHYHALQNAHTNLNRVVDSFKSHLPPDLIAETAGMSGPEARRRKPSMKKSSRCTTEHQPARHPPGNLFSRIFAFRFAIQKYHAVEVSSVFLRFQTCNSDYLVMRLLKPHKKKLKE